MTNNKYYDGALKLYNKVKIAFIGSNSSDGYPEIKAILIADRKPGMKEVIIKTNTSSKHVAQLREDSRGCLYFLSLIDFKGVMLKGKYEVVEDAEMKRKYWNKGDEKYYSKGDSDYCLLVFTPEVGRYYHRFDSGDFEI